MHGAQVGVSAEEGNIFYYDENKEPSELIADEAEKRFNELDCKGMDEVEKLVLMCECVINAEKAYH